MLKNSRILRCHNQLKNEIANDTEWFFLGLDESTNVSDTIQLFIQGVKCFLLKQFEVTTEVASTNSLLGAATGNILTKLRKH